MLEAEEDGLTQANVDQQKSSNKDPGVQRLLGVSEDTGKLLGLDAEWAYRIVKQVGNYGESFERNLGPKTPIGLPRGVNNLWTKGGLMYAPPSRADRACDRADRRRGLARAAARAPACANGCCRARSRSSLLALLAGFAQQHRRQPRGAPDQVGLRLPARPGRLQHRRAAVRLQRRATAICAPSRSAWPTRLRVALAGIVLASVLGVVVGLMRLSRHPLVAGFGARLCRGVPQHAAADPAARHLPARHRAAARVLERDLDRGRRAAVEGRAADRGAGRRPLRAARRGRGVRRRRRRRLSAVARRWLDVGAGLVGARSPAASRRCSPGCSSAPVGGWSRPALDGFLISGGASLTPEFLALLAGPLAVHVGVDRRAGARRRAGRAGRPVARGARARPDARARRWRR